MFCQSVICSETRTISTGYKEQQHVTGALLTTRILKNQINFRLDLSFLEIVIIIKNIKEEVENLTFYVLNNK